MSELDSGTIRTLYLPPSPAIPPTPPRRPRDASDTDAELPSIRASSRIAQADSSTRKVRGRGITASSRQLHNFASSQLRIFTISHLHAMRPFHPSSASTLAETRRLRNAPETLSSRRTHALLISLRVPEDLPPILPFWRSVPIRRLCLQRA